MGPWGEGQNGCECRPRGEGRGGNGEGAWGGVVGSSEAGGGRLRRARCLELCAQRCGLGCRARIASTLPRHVLRHALLQHVHRPIELAHVGERGGLPRPQTVEAGAALLAQALGAVCAPRGPNASTPQRLNASTHHVQGDEEYDEEDEEGEGGPTYEELIELGQQIGDVKAERYC